MKLTIEYDKDHGHIYPDGRSEAWVDATLKLFLKRKKNQSVKVCSSLLIDYFRLRLAQGIIKTDQIEFTFEGKTLNHNKYGRIEHWPKGYCDIPIEPMEQLLILGSDMAKKEKKWPKGVDSVPEDNELTGLQDIRWKKN